jgi:hypothetical protein
MRWAPRASSAQPRPHRSFQRQSLGARLRHDGRCDCRVPPGLRGSRPAAPRSSVRYCSRNRFFTASVTIRMCQSSLVGRRRIMIALDHLGAFAALLLQLAPPRRAGPSREPARRRRTGHIPSVVGRLEVTRSRAYKKNDQAFVEQKNGAVVKARPARGADQGLARGRAAAHRDPPKARLVVTMMEVRS